MKTGCLLIHGFTGGPYEILPLANHLFGLGFEVEIPTLPGHGQHPIKLEEVIYQDWIRASEEAYLRLAKRCKRVVLIGFSMGGLLCIHLASRYDVKGLVTMSTPVYLYDFKKMIANFIQEHKRGKRGLPFAYIKRAIQTPFSAFKEFLYLVRITKKILGDVKQPVLILQGLRDDTVRVESARYLYDHFNSSKKRIFYLEDSRHLICCGDDLDKVNGIIVDFIYKL